MRKPPGIAEEQLRACLQDQYDLYPVTLEFLPRGKDYKAGVYRVVSEQSTAYLLKVTSRSLYEPRCLVPHYLNDQGITSVVAPVPTRSGALWMKLMDWTVIVYPFIDGDTSLTGMTNEQWKEVGTIFKRIHQVMLPSLGFESLRKETFDPTEYARWVRAFETQHLHSRHGGSVSERALRTSWVAHQSTIHTGVTSLEKLAEVLQSRRFPYVICHADLHPANLIRDHAGHVFVIDWDEVMLAPKERDFIFVREPQAAAFWEGYGQREIDWVALTYYLWERVVQDLIVCAQDVCFRDDLGEETRADIAQLFHEIVLGRSSTINAAYAAAAYLAT
ncbi:MAG: aminoglycoside phosphotransferase family protein [Chloroflexota bacterium]|nr:MAG: aminoglycoside phosphotransferase family protein [Chloroflexota bacterium]